MSDFNKINNMPEKTVSQLEKKIVVIKELIGRLSGIKKIETQAMLKTFYVKLENLKK